MPVREFFISAANFLVDTDVACFKQRFTFEILASVRIVRMRPAERDYSISLVFLSILSQRWIGGNETTPPKPRKVFVDPSPNSNLL